MAEDREPAAPCPNAAGASTTGIADRLFCIGCFSEESTYFRFDGEGILFIVLAPAELGRKDGRKSISANTRTEWSRSHVSNPGNTAQRSFIL